MEERRSVFSQLNREFKGYWPIRWRELLQFKLMKNALFAAPRAIRYGIVAATLLAVTSVIFAASSLYLAVTVTIGARGGILRQAVVGGEMSFFNPLIDRTDPVIGRENNLPEKKVMGYLFLPLYTIDFPNFLVNSKDEPQIQPVLLSKPPVWQDAENQDIATRYKRLEMELRNDLVWSDGKSITVNDIQYSFERLKEAKGNPEFRGVFESVTFEKIDNQKFVLVAQESTPSLRYKSNFSPVSSEYYENKNTEGLLIDKRSARPSITSGPFIMRELVDNPETTRKEEQNNPIVIDGQSRVVVLENSQNPNYKKIFGEEVKLDTILMKRYDRIAEGSSNQYILSQAAAEKSIDLFERNYESDISLQPSRVVELLKLRQVQVPTNTYLNLFYNIKRGPTGFLINQSLRKYITCNLLNYTNPEFKKYLIEIPKERRILPVEFGDFTTIDCGTNFAEILDTNYEYTTDPTTKRNKVTLKVSGQQVELIMIAFPENLTIAQDIASFFESTIGIPLVIVSSEREVEQRLTDKNYNMALLAFNVINRDISENYSAKKRDLVSIPGNDRVAQYKFNENLDVYTASNGTDRTARQNLIDFFSKELVSMNLYQYQTEYNFSPVIKELEQSLPDIASGITQIELQAGRWYINTERVFRR